MTDTAPDPADHHVFHARRADAALWQEARELYATGLSPRAIADHVGLGERNVRRRAGEERWARRPAALSDASVRRQAQLDADPVFRAFAEDRDRDVGELLTHPDAIGLRRFAFRRATEAAAMGAPVECVAWLRVVDHVRRNVDALAYDDRTLEDIDMRRADYMRALVVEDAAAAAAESEMAEMSARRGADIPDSLETKAWVGAPGPRASRALRPGVHRLRPARETRAVREALAAPASAPA